MRKPSLVMAVSAVLLCVPAGALAETITLKSGQKMEGKILEKTDKIVLIEWNGVGVTYRAEEIESIDDTPFKPGYGTTVVPAPEQVPVGYDEDLLREGIRFIAPAGWVKQKNKLVYLFSQPENKAMISIFLHDQEITQDAFDHAISTIRSTKKPLSEENIMLQGVACRVFTWQEKAMDGQIVQLKAYHWLRGTRAYGMSYSAILPFFDTYLPAFDTSLGTLEVITP